MLSTPLDASYLVALQQYLQYQVLVDPPFGIGIFPDSIHIGKWQASPEYAPPVITLHIGDPKETADSGRKEWRHEMRPGTEEMTGGSCATSTWDYRYSIHISFYMTRTGQEQTEAITQGSRLAQWMAKKVNEANVRTLIAYGLAYPSDFGETPFNAKVIAIEAREGGGPGSYIAKSVLFIEHLVYRSA